MKLLKYLPLALVAVVATGCSNGGPEPNNIAPGVYFPKYNATKINMNPLDESSVSFSADICRTFNTVGTAVTLTSKVEMKDMAAAEEGLEIWGAAPAGIFEIPSQVVFENNFSKTSFTTVVNTDEIDFYQPFRVTLTISDPTVSLYGSATYSYVFQKTQDAWSFIGTGLYTDGWVLAAFQTSAGAIPVDKYPYEVEMEQNVGDPAMFRVVNPYNNPNLPFNLPNTDPGTENHYIEIDLTREDIPLIFPIYPGFDFGGSDGPITVMNIEGYYAYEGATYDEIEGGVDPAVRSTFSNNELVIPRPYFFLAGDGPYTWANVQQAAIAFPDDEDRDATARPMSNAQKAVKFFGEKVRANF